MNIHLFTSYFDVNRRGTLGFDTLPCLSTKGYVQEYKGPSFCS